MAAVGVARPSVLDEIARHLRLAERQCVLIGASGQSRRDHSHRCDQLLGRIESTRTGWREHSRR